VVVIDVCHEIAPHDVRAGGLTLARSAQYLAPGVVLAVVDPGVGTDRRPVAVEVGDGESMLVGPDNGLLAPAVAMVGGAGRAFVLDRDEYHLPAPGPTFAGRDVFAPVAAHLCLGVEPTELGTEIDPASLLPGILPVARAENGGLAAEVLWVDRFGNAQLNVDPDDLAGWGDRILMRIGEQVRTARRVTAYDELKTGEVGLLVDSYGLVSIAVARGSAAMTLRLDPGAAVGLDPGDEEIAVIAPDVGVELRPGNGR
jgi:S-adenosylmethionine hydrolase